MHKFDVCSHLLLGLLMDVSLIFSLGCFQNLADFFQCTCFGMFKPNVVDWTKQYKLFHLVKEKNVHSVWSFSRCLKPLNWTINKTGYFLIFTHCSESCLFLFLLFSILNLFCIGYSRFEYGTITVFPHLVWA